MLPGSITLVNDFNIFCWCGLIMWAKARASARLKKKHCTITNSVTYQYWTYGVTYSIQIDTCVYFTIHFHTESLPKSKQRQSLDHESEYSFRVFTAAAPPRVGSCVDAQSRLLILFKRLHCAHNKIARNKLSFHAQYSMGLSNFNMN